jgi:hypothetical protein
MARLVGEQTLEVASYVFGNVTVYFSRRDS